MLLRISLGREQRVVLEKLLAETSNLPEDLPEGWVQSFEFEASGINIEDIDIEALTSEVDECQNY